MKLGIVADDNTGASDAAGMLTERGVRTLLLLDLDTIRNTIGSTPINTTDSLGRFDAIVIGSQVRSMTPSRAYERTRAATSALVELGVETIQLKYCSTFDSTPRGNIGPSLDAALDSLGVDRTVVCPSLPVNGRTVRGGNLFVDGVLLHESPLRNHPLNPMTDANLVRWLGYQTERRVALCELEQVHRGPDELRARLEQLVAGGASYVVVDAVEQSDLDIIARATHEWPLLSGGSGITASVAGTLFGERPPLDFGERRRATRGPIAVVSGSMSPATRAQTEHALANGNGFAGVALDVEGAVRGTLDLRPAVQAAAAHMADGRNVVIYSQPGTVERVQQVGRELGLSATQTGERIAGRLAEIARELLERGCTKRLVVSGGETAGAVCAGASLDAFEVGLPVDPGVPACYPLSRPDLMVVLKSGNFGGEDFYGRVAAL